MRLETALTCGREATRLFEGLVTRYTDVLEILEVLLPAIDEQRLAAADRAALSTVRTILETDRAQLPILRAVIADQRKIWRKA